MARPGRPKKKTAEAVVKDIKRQTRRKFSSEEKIRIVLEGLKGEESIAEICRREGSIAPAQYYRWSKDFIEAGKKRLNGDTEREANSSEVKELKSEADGLKMVVAEQALEIPLLKKLAWSRISFKKYMRFNQDEKYEIIRLVEESGLGINRTLRELGIPKRTFYNWYGRYKKNGYDGLAPKNRSAVSQWNKIPDAVRGEVVELALDRPELSPRELAHQMIDHKEY